MAVTFPRSLAKRRSVSPVEVASLNPSAARLSPVDQWRLSQLKPRAREVVEALPASDWPAMLMAFQMIGDDLAPTPTARLLMVRLDVEIRSTKTLEVLIYDTNPVVRYAACMAFDEVEGTRKIRSHMKAIMEAENFGRKWRAGLIQRQPVSGFLCGPPLSE
jgi:hypothetical protein